MLFTVGLFVYFKVLILVWYFDVLCHFSVAVRLMNLESGP